MSTHSKSKPPTFGANAAYVPVTNPHGVSASYANSVGAAATVLDFSLFFLEMGQTPGEKGPIAKNEVKAIVTLPIALAASLIQVLQNIVDGHRQALSSMAEQSRIKADAEKH